MGITRRAVLTVLLGTALAGGCAAAPEAPRETATTTSTTPTTTTVAPADPAPLRELERRHGVRLGLHAVNVETGRTLAHREDERFALLSTFKTLAAAALLHEHPLASGYFETVITYTQADLVANSPVTSTRVATGMTVAELCEAAITRSDNTAGNLLLKELGGPEGLTRFLRSTGDTESRLDRWETELNTAIPGDVRDTTTPRAIANSYRELVLGDTLGKPERERLKAWLLANTTGDARIRAGLPEGWTTADKTGTGDYGSANDVAITWTEDGTPIVLSVMTTKPAQDAEVDQTVLAEAARTVAEALR